MITEQQIQKFIKTLLNFDDDAMENVYYNLCTIDYDTGIKHVKVWSLPTLATLCGMLNECNIPLDSVYVEDYYDNLTITFLNYQIEKT